MTTRSKSHRGTLVDVSATGARIRGADLPDVDEDLVLSVDKLKAFGTVRWHRASECGIEFDRPLRRPDVDQLRYEVAKAAGLPPELKAALDDWNLGVAR